MLHYRIMEPAGAAAGNADMLVVPNHLGASIEDDMSPRGQYLADATSRRVLVYDRPASGLDAGWRPDERSQLRANYAGTVARTGQALARILETEGAGTVHVAGQSGGATEAAALVRTETLPVDRLTFLDGVGLNETSAVGGLARYTQHMAREIIHSRSLFGRGTKGTGNISVEELAQNDKLRRVSRQSLRSVAEMWTYADVYRKPVSRDNLLYIARRMPEVTMNVQLVGNTFTAHAHYAQQIGRAIVAARNMTPAARRAPVHVNLQREAYHSHFDTAEVFAQHANETYQLRPEPRQTA
jgi:pimeloyl-ACP methyl ester carboxylesterase